MTKLRGFLLHITRKSIHILMPHWTGKWPLNRVNCSASSFFKLQITGWQQENRRQFGLFDPWNNLWIQGRLLQVMRSNTRSSSNIVNVFSVWDLYTWWRWAPVELNAFLLLTPTEIYKDVILQMKPFNNDNKPSCETAFAWLWLQLQLQPCPAPPLMAPRWLADRSLQDGASCSRTHGAHVWGMWKPRLARQPGRTLHHLTKMKSVTGWPVLPLPSEPPPSACLSCPQVESGRC